MAISRPLDGSEDEKLDEALRVLSLFLERFDDADPWLPGEFRDMAMDCLRGTQYDPALPSGGK